MCDSQEATGEGGSGVPKLFNDSGGNEDFSEKLAKQGVAVNLNEVV